MVGAGSASAVSVPVRSIIEAYGVAGGVATGGVATGGVATGGVAHGPSINDIFIPGAHVAVPDTDVNMGEPRTEEIP
jgi:hypothetical protein